VDFTVSLEDTIKKHRSMIQNVIRHTDKYPHARAGPAYVGSLARYTDNLIRWIAEQIAAANHKANGPVTTATVPELQNPRTAPYDENLENVSQHAAPSEIICIGDSNDDLGGSGASQEDGEAFPALHSLVGETEESDEDADDEEFQSCESEGSGCEESEPSDIEPENEAEQDAGEAISAVQFLNAEIEWGDHEEDNMEYECASSQVPESEDYESEPSDTEPEDEMDEAPEPQRPEDQEMEDEQPQNDEQYGQDMDASSDFSDRPQGIYDWIPNYVDNALPAQTSGQPIEPVEHWPPDLSAWASLVSNIPDSDPHKHLVRLEWKPRFPSQFPHAKMKSVIRGICHNKDVEVRSIKVQRGHVYDIYVATADERIELIASQLWLHTISVDGCWAEIDTSARPPPPRIPNRAHELPFTFRIHWFCNCAPYKDWMASQDATPIVENIRAALESSGDSLLAAAAPRVHAVQIRPRSGDIWVYVCSIPARDYMVRRENARLWVHRLKHGHTAQIHLQEHRSTRSGRHAITIQRNLPLTDTAGNTKRGGLEDEIKLQKKRRREKRRRQRARKRERERQEREERMYVW
jgi:hypothetical protein